MKIDVDMTKCQHYGQCVFEAPAAFQLDEDDKLVFVSDLADSERTRVEAAVDVCPMQAIVILD